MNKLIIKKNNNNKINIIKKNENDNNNISKTNDKILIQLVKRLLTTIIIIQTINE